MYPYISQVYEMILLGWYYNLCNIWNNGSRGQYLAILRWLLCHSLTSFQLANSSVFSHRNYEEILCTTDIYFYFTWNHWDILMSGQLNNCKKQHTFYTISPLMELWFEVWYNLFLNVVRKRKKYILICFGCSWNVLVLFARDAIVKFSRMVT